jgi:hypothetical protein
LSPYHQRWFEYRRAFPAGQRAEALVAVRALDRSAPGTKATYNHAVEALENGYLAEAVATLETLSPDRGPMRGWVPYHEVLGAAHHLLGHFENELALGRDAQRRFPGRLYALRPTVPALAATGRIAELDRLLAAAVDLPPDPYGLLAHQGRRTEAEAIATRLASDRRPFQVGAPLVARARIATALGDSAGAVELLRQAFAAGKGHDLWLHRDADFDALRALASFQQLIVPRSGP